MSADPWLRSWREPTEKNKSMTVIYNIVIHLIWSGQNLVCLLPNLKHKYQAACPTQAKSLSMSKHYFWWITENEKLTVILILLAWLICKWFMATFEAERSCCLCGYFCCFQHSVGNWYILTNTRWNTWFVAQNISWNNQFFHRNGKCLRIVLFH